MNRCGRFYGKRGWRSEEVRKCGNKKDKGRRHDKRRGVQHYGDTGGGMMMEVVG
jgi:hypothetical protein